VLAQASQAPSGLLIAVITLEPVCRLEWSLATEAGERKAMPWLRRMERLRRIEMSLGVGC
jgi:hypothetical protein